MKHMLTIILLFSFFDLFSQNLSKISIFFVKNSVEITTTSQDEFSLWLNDSSNHDLKIEKIEVYSDTNGTTQHNQNLSLRRFTKIKEILNALNYQIPTPVIIGENYPDSLENITNYDYWRRIDLYYFSKTRNVNEVQETKIDTFLKSAPADTTPTPSKFFVDEFNPIILSIEFYGGKTKLLNSSYKELNLLYDFMKSNPNVNVLIRGHVCCGNKMRLSKRRAKAVYKELRKRGIAKKRMNFKGMSNKNPIAFPENTDNDRQKNRRVDVIFSI